MEQTFLRTWDWLVDLFKARSRLEQVRAEKQVLEERCASLEEQLRNERSLREKLNERLQKLETPPVTLEGDEISVLRVLSDQPWRDVGALAQLLAMHRTRVEYNLGRLKELGYIQDRLVASFGPGGGTTFALAQLGRAYLVKNGQLPRD